MSKPKSFKQGDVLFERIDKIPSNSKQIEFKDIIEIKNDNPEFIPNGDLSVEEQAESLMTSIEATKRSQWKNFPAIKDIHIECLESELNSLNISKEILERIQQKVFREFAK